MQRVDQLDRDVPEPEPAASGTWRSSLRRPTIVAGVFSLLVGLLVGGLFVSSVLRRPVIYQSVTALVIDQPRAVVASGSEGILLKLNRLRAKYVTLLRTPIIVDPIAQRLGLPPGRVARALVPSLPGNTLVIVVASRTSDASLARDIAAAAADELVAFVDREMETNKIDPAIRIRLGIVSSAQLGQKIAPKASDAAKAGGLYGGLALAATYVVYQGVAARRRSR